MKTINILHIITGLNTGGAEMMLFKLLSAMDKTKYRASVISLMDKGTLGARIESLGISVKELRMNPRMPSPHFVILLSKMISEANPDLIQTWLYHADLIGGLANKISLDVPLIWNIHNGKLNSNDKLTTRMVAKFCAVMSTYIPARIVYVAKSSQSAHTQLGYSERKAITIPNGFDVAHLKPDTSGRELIRKELEVDDNTLLIGLIARYNSQKDHKNFLNAARLLVGKFKPVRFIMCGDNIDANNEELNHIIAENALADYCILLGRRSDVANIANACDIVTSSSFSEAFPLVIGEAMSCGVPCAVTDVGDSAWIVGDTGRVVPPRDPQALASAWEEMIEMGQMARRALGMQARQRIIDNFSLTVIANRFERLYDEIHFGRIS